MINNKNSKILILYRPDINKKERIIFEKVFGKENVTLAKYFEKGITGGVFDVQFFIDIISEPGIKELLVGLVLLLVKELFDRNRARKFYDEKRPRYTDLVLGKRKSSITISNINKENRLTIEHTQYDVKKTIIEDYSEEKLKKILEED